MEIQIQMARTAAQPRDRRGAIANALYRCIREKGFANTSLKDIADQADMTPSHVFYYFENKASILEYDSAAVCRRNTAEFPDLQEPDLDRLLDQVATFCMGEGQTSIGLLGVIQELTGLAVHDPNLHSIKPEHTVVWREYLEAFFDRARPILGLSSHNAAHLAHAMLIGLNTNALFGGDLDPETARQLFRNTLQALTVDSGSSQNPV
jgi:AcrR family transcriptional regulator